MSQQVISLEEVVAFVSAAHPAGFYYKDLTDTDFDRVHWASLAMVEDPLVLKVSPSKLGATLEALIGQGANPTANCALLVGIPMNQIPGTLSDIAAKARRLETQTLFLLIADERSTI